MIRSAEVEAGEAQEKTGEWVTKGDLSETRRRRRSVENIAFLTEKLRLSAVFLLGLVSLDFSSQRRLPPSRWNSGTSALQRVTTERWRERAHMQAIRSIARPKSNAGGLCGGRKPGQSVASDSGREEGGEEMAAYRG